MDQPGRFHGQWRVNILLHSLPPVELKVKKGKKGSGVRCDRSNSLGRTRNSVVSAVTSRFGATASHYRKQASPVTPSAQISAENVFGQKDSDERIIILAARSYGRQ